MKRMLSGWRLVLFSGVVATVLAGAIVYASIPSSNGVISACYSMFGGVVRVIDPDAGATCFAWEKRLNWNQIGPPIYMNRNFQDVALAVFPGVTTATLRLPAGSYMMWAKFRVITVRADTSKTNDVGKIPLQRNWREHRNGVVRLSGSGYWQLGRLSARRCAPGRRRCRAG